MNENTNHQAEIFQAMQQPEFYPHPADSIQQVETHISKVFLTGNYVYKIKKALKLGFLDFSTLEKRRHFCTQEIILNRRLAPHVYLEVIPITFHEGKYSLNGLGTAVEYAVKMRQLSDDCAMPQLLKKSKLDAEKIKSLARRLTEFYSRAETNVHISTFGSREAVAKNLEDNFAEIQVFAGEFLDERLFQIVRAATGSFLRGRKALFAHRMEKGKIRDCHGDLKPEHIYFTEQGICIVDCIEFNAQFRYQDITSDLAFLIMELEYEGFPQLGQNLLDEYIDLTNDYECVLLLSLYKCYRAMVKCKVNCLRLLGCDFGKAASQKLLANTRRYMELACGYAEQFKRPVIWVVCGMPASGKSTVSKELAKIFCIRTLRSDVIRKQLFGIAPETAGDASFGQEIYAKDATSLTYGKMLLLAQEELEKGRSVILDATYGSRHHRENVLSLAKDMDVGIVFAECRAPEEVTRERLIRRETSPSVSDARIHHFEDFKKSFEPLDEIGADMHICVNTQKPLEETVGDILTRDYALLSSAKNDSQWMKGGKMFKKILTATDLPTVYDAPVLSAERIAERNMAELRILHVLESASAENRHLVRHFETGEEIIADADYEALVRQEMEKSCADVLTSQTNCSIRVTTGFPWEEIVRMAREVAADLIVLGPHSGRAEEKGVVRVRGKIGSTVEGVLMRESCPVLIVNQVIPEHMLGFQHILACIDFSKSCECALYFGIKMAAEYGSKLSLFHMIPIPPYPKYSSENYEADLENAKKKLEQFCREEIPAGTAHEYHVWGGALPHQEILKCAEKTKADLIIMGSHTKESAGKWYAGSAVERVSFRSACPIMAVTDPEALIEWGEDMEARLQRRKDADRRICVYTTKTRK
ncbi:MAG: universal stress protein [Desulfobacterales bacterium]